MSYARATGILCVLMGLYWYLVVRSRRGMKELYDFRPVSPEHYERIMDALARFEEERTDRADIHTLSAHRATVSKHLHELKFRMPNDTKDVETLDHIIKTKERDLDDAIQAIRKEQGKTLEFPYGVGTYFMHLEPILLKQDREQSPTYSKIS